MKLVMQFCPSSCQLFLVVKIFSSAPCSQTPSVCAPLLMSQTKFHTHTGPANCFSEPTDAL
jgi:hypothetical protein